MRTKDRASEISDENPMAGDSNERRMVEADVKPGGSGARNDES